MAASRDDSGSPSRDARGGWRAYLRTGYLGVLTRGRLFVTGFLKELRSFVRKLYR